MINVSKKILALIMSLIMAFSCMAVSASATGDGTAEEIQIAAPVCEFDMAEMAITVTKPANIHHGENYYPVEITIAPADGVTKTVDAEGNIVFSGVVLETEYTVTAAINDNVDDGITDAGTNTATVTPTVTVPGTADVCVFNEEDRTITVDELPDVVIGGIQFAAVAIIEPSTSSMYTADGKKVFYNLEYGTTYTVKAFVQPSPDAEMYYSEDNFTVTVKNDQEAPTAPVPVAITSSSITVAAAAGCQYIVRALDGTVVYDWTDSKGKDAIMFDELDENTQYIVAAKKKATDDYYESAESSITVKTKLAGKGKADTPALEDKTNASITVAAVEGVEYSIDGGKTWQASNEFKGLKADTQYEVVARYTYDSKTQDPSEASDALVVKTNAKANYEANKKNISIDVSIGEYAESETTFTAKGNGPADMNNVQYGDTRVVPVSYVVVFGSETVKENVAWDTVKVSQTGSFTAPDYAEKIVTVKVTFEVQEYKGVKDGKADWKPIEIITESKDVKVGPEDNAGNRAKGILEVILNFLLNTVPAFFAQALQSDVWARLLEALGNLGKAMG